MALLRRARAHSRADRDLVDEVPPISNGSTKIPGGSAGIIGSTVKLPPPVGDPVAAAFAHTFWWSVGAILLAFIPTLFLPNRAPGAERSGDEAQATGADGEKVAGAMLD